MWRVHFNNTAGEEIYFTGNGEISSGYDLVNWISLPNKSFASVKVGAVDPEAPTGDEFIINPEAIVWATEVGLMWMLERVY